MPSDEVLNAQQQFLDKLYTYRDWSKSATKSLAFYEATFYRRVC